MEIKVKESRHLTRTRRKLDYACQLGCEGIVSKRLGSRYRPGPTKCADWIKVKNPTAPAVRREREEEWNR
jgi:ATP-dependent DNA ligase